MSYNISCIHDLSFEELEDFSPNLKGWRQYFFIGVSMVAIGLAIVVQKAVYNSLKNNPREINQMINPSQVSIFYLCEDEKYFKLFTAWIFTPLLLFSPVFLKSINMTFD